MLLQRKFVSEILLLAKPCQEKSATQSFDRFALIDFIVTAQQQPQPQQQNNHNCSWVETK